MEQFNLEKWLKDKSRKVVTRSGRPVRIVCWDAPTKNPIYGFVEGDDGITSWRKDGRFSNLIDNVDLFFPDEEEELTEFEELLASILFDREYEGKTNTGDDIERGMLPYRLAAKEYSSELLDLARKEIEKENSEFKPKFTYNEKDYSELANKLIEFRNNTPLCSVSYRDGEGRKIILHYEKEITDLVKEKILKSLPKWKKAKKDEELDCHVAIQQDDRVVLSDFVQKDEYYITLDVLKKLPKEE